MAPGYDLMAGFQAVVCTTLLHEQVSTRSLPKPNPPAPFQQRKPKICGSPPQFWCLFRFFHFYFAALKGSYRRATGRKTGAKGHTTRQQQKWTWTQGSAARCPHLTLPLISPCWCDTLSMVLCCSWVSSSPWWQCRLLKGQVRDHNHSLLPAAGSARRHRATAELSIYNEIWHFKSELTKM